MGAGVVGFLVVGALVTGCCCCEAKQKSVRPFDPAAVVTTIFGRESAPLPKSVTVPVTSARNPFSRIPSAVQVLQAGNEPCFPSARPMSMSKAFPASSTSYATE